MSEEDVGRSPSGPGSQASPEAASASSPSVSIPNADGYTTIVVRHKSQDAAQSFVETAHREWPFMDNKAATQMTFISVGDTASVLDAVRMALMCNALGNGERVELALDLEANCFTWAECLAYAEAEWDLKHADGEFVEAQAIEARRAATAQTGAVEDESAVPQGCAHA